MGRASTFVFAVGFVACSESTEVLPPGLEDNPDAGRDLPDLRAPLDLGPEPDPDLGRPLDGGGVDAGDLGPVDADGGGPPPECPSVQVGTRSYEVVRIERPVEAQLQLFVNNVPEDPDALLGLSSGEHVELGSRFHREGPGPLTVVPGLHDVSFKGDCSEQAPCGIIDTSVFLESGRPAELRLSAVEVSLEAAGLFPNSTARWSLYDDQGREVGRGDYPATRQVLAGRYFLESRAFGAGSPDGGLRTGPIEALNLAREVVVDFTPTRVAITPLIDGVPLQDPYRVSAVPVGAVGPPISFASGQAGGEVVLALAPGSYDLLISTVAVGDEAPFTLLEGLEVGSEALELDAPWDVEQVDVVPTGTSGLDGVFIFEADPSRFVVRPGPARLPLDTYALTWSGYCQAGGSDNCGAFVFLPVRPVTEGGELLLDVQARSTEARVLDEAGNPIAGNLLVSQAGTSQGLGLPLEAGVASAFLPVADLDLLYAPVFGSPFEHAIALGRFNPLREPELDFELEVQTFRGVLFVGERRFLGREGALPSVSVREGTGSAEPEAVIGGDGRFETTVSSTDPERMELWYEPSPQCRDPEICLRQRIQRCEPVR